jgi:hypothetical protein
MILDERVLVEKAGRDNGWEAVLSSGPEKVVLASANHPSVAEVVKAGIEESSEPSFAVTFSRGSPLLPRELARAGKPQFNSGEPQFNSGKPPFALSGYHELAAFLTRAASLAASLPNNAEAAYLRRVEELDREEETKPSSVLATEVKRLTRQRVGQDVFREALMGYWGGACAVTGIALPEVLRASHAKPWADCESDAERLDVFNGFLLCANLDALFDRGLITFDDDGQMTLSGNLSKLSPEDRRKLGLTAPLRTRWLAPEHRKYLAWHRGKVFVQS